MKSSLPSPVETLRWLKHMAWPKNAPDSPRQQLRSTAYLDGLRGFAAFLVYVHHNELWVHAATNDEFPIFEKGYGVDGNYRFVTAPVIRTFFTGGHIAVATFYVISGYVLSAKPLSQIHNGDYLKLYDSLASSFFRRWFRLWLPLIITTIVWVMSWHVFGYWVQCCKVKPTIGEELWNWYVEMKNLSFLFKEGSQIWVSFNTHLWSIPLEMRGSIITFCACLSLARATIKARLVCEVALIIYFMYIVDGYYGALFISGMLQCDLDQLARRSSEGNTYFPGFLRSLEEHKTTIFYTLFGLGMLIAGVPTDSQDIKNLRAAPGWYYLSFLKPQAVFDYKWFYLFFAANMLVASVPRIRLLKAFFESRFCQFLGRISFSLYLVHGPLLGAVGDRIFHAVGWVRSFDDSDKMLANWVNLFPLPRIGPMGLELSFLLPQIFFLPFTLWVADVTTRAVDEPSVRFAAWLFKRIQGGTPPAPKQEESTLPLRRLA
ncbi:acyltransferase 3 [Lasiosphaeria miniovina]|uniref:Acyltransferase 3 n=1 Tax=Lasiosphaeria miniovina TaxID=1954250 RepID=A0AA39ZRG9_9PEZI|nr:acyltransferase 3 [Lasiosphaeria miniovina]KAK0702120.1 acyltransferase 3 [Lasiosphaeria miniovina]